MHINYLHTIQQGWHNTSRRTDTYNASIYGKVVAKRHTNRQNDVFMLAQQARNLQFWSIFFIWGVWNWGLYYTTIVILCMSAFLLNSSSRC